VVTGAAMPVSLVVICAAINTRKPSKIPHTLTIRAH
jgi:hypothetical protein